MDKRKFFIVGGSILAISAGATGAAVAAGAGDEGDETVSGPAADHASAAAQDATHGGTANSVERDSENGATWEVEVTKPDGATVDVRLDESYNLVVVEGDSETGDADEGTEGAGENESAGEDESGPDDGDGQPITGSELDKASAAALRETGGGRVTASELDDEEGYYEIEVTKQDGSQVDVHLDRAYNVIDAESDGGADD
jgi:uncharacterized membrane protein YkoI